MIKYFLVSIMFFCFSSLMAVEQRPYSVISQLQDHIEIRHYQAVSMAEVTIQGSRDEAASAAFRRLFAYIRGKNARDEKIAMTAPVSQTLASNNRWNICFFLPQSLAKKTAPSPTDNDIRIIDIQPCTLAAIRFKGKGAEKDLQKNQNELYQELTKAGYLFEKKPMYAFYNAPFVPGFLRRNEVLVPITKKP